MITRHLTLALIALATLALTATAQVRITVTTRSPLPAQLSAWTRDRSLVQVAVSNPAGGPAYPDAHIAFVVRNIETGAVVARTKDNYAALPRLSIPPGPSTSLRFGPDVIDERTIDVDPAYRNLARATNALPEGRYEFCARLVNDRGADIASTGTACGTFRIDVPRAPELISPADHDTLENSALPRFSWVPGNTPGTPPVYRLRIVPVYPGQDGSTAFQRNAPIAERTVTGTSYQYLPTDPTLGASSSSAFVWGVHLLDGTGSATVTSGIRWLNAGGPVRGNNAGGGQAGGNAAAAPCSWSYSMTICEGETITPFIPKEPKVTGNTDPSRASGSIDGKGQVSITGLAAGTTTITVEITSLDEHHTPRRCTLVIKVTVRKCDKKTDGSGTGDGSGSTPTGGTGSGSGSTPTGGTGTGTNAGGNPGGNNAGAQPPCSWEYSMTICKGETITPFIPKEPKVIGNTDPSRASGSIDGKGQVSITGLAEGTTTITVEITSLDEHHTPRRCTLVIKVTVKECDKKADGSGTGDGSGGTPTGGTGTGTNAGGNPGGNNAGAQPPCSWEYSMTICKGETITPFIPKEPKVIGNTDPSKASGSIDGKGQVSITGLAAGTTTITVEITSLDEHHTPRRCTLVIKVTVKECDKKADGSGTGDGSGGTPTGGTGSGSGGTPTGGTGTGTNTGGTPKPSDDCEKKIAELRRAAAEAQRRADEAAKKAAGARKAADEANDKSQKADDAASKAADASKAAQDDADAKVDAAKQAADDAQKAADDYRKAKEDERSKQWQRNELKRKAEEARKKAADAEKAAKDALQTAKKTREDAARAKKAADKAKEDSARAAKEAEARAADAKRAAEKAEKAKQALEDAIRNCK